VLITEGVLAPQAGEYIEIFNVTDVTIDLSTYYLADSTAYWRVPSGGVLPQASDFVVKFPDGALMAPGQVITISISAIENGFLDTYGTQPDFALPPGIPPEAGAQQMQEAFPGSIGGGHNLADAGEGVHLFYWDGQSDLVKDVDVVRLGMPSLLNDIINKSNASVDGPDPDTTPSTYATDAMTMPVMQSAAAAGLSHKRLDFEGAHEVTSGGNGVGGHDETTENISITWDGSGTAFTAPDPGVAMIGPTTCVGDITPGPSGDGVVNVDDLLTVINAWGPCPPPPQDCPADVSPLPRGDGVVNVDDLLIVINAWGPCN
jgi:hypothetical protein